MSFNPAPKPTPKIKKAPKGLKPTKLPPINTERKKRAFKINFGGQYRDFIASLPCDVCEKRPPSDPAHLTSRGAGGKASDQAPMCRTCHRGYDNHDPAIRIHEARLRRLALKRSAAWGELFPAEKAS